MVGADPAGELKVALRVREGAVRQVAIASTRLQLAQRMLAGKAADDAVALVPRLFSICGESQRLAAELALAAARGAADPLGRERVRRLENEMAQEYLWRVLIDWTKAIGGRADPKSIAAARAALAYDDRDGLRAIVEREVLGGDAKQWYDSDRVPGFEAWIEQQATPAARFLGEVRRDGLRHGASEVALLPPFDEVDAGRRIVARLDADPRYERQPTLDGRPAETGAAARLRAHPLVAALARAAGRSSLVRFTARLVELARIACGAAAPQRLAGSLQRAAGRGLGWVETARGLLLHQIELDGECVARYRIVAPTEWNLHPHGAFTQAMLGMHETSTASLRRRADWLLQSLDPCVAYTLQVDHA